MSIDFDPAKKLHAPISIDTLCQQFIADAQIMLQDHQANATLYIKPWLTALPLILCFWEGIFAAKASKGMAWYSSPRSVRRNLSCSKFSWKNNKFAIVKKRRCPKMRKFLAIEWLFVWLFTHKNHDQCGYPIYRNTPE